MIRPLLALLPVVALAGAGCRRPPDTAAPPGAPAAGTRQPVAVSPPTAPTAPAREVHVAVLGDSLAAGYGLPERQAFPAVLERMLSERGLRARVQNAGVSGDTTAGGLQRLDWLLKQRPDVVVVQLGANDGLRGLPLDGTERNLRDIVTRCQAAGARVLLAGMLVPDNMGGEYGRRFEGIFPRVAQDTGVPLVPFLLEGVALVPELNLPDGIHPTAEGQERLATTVLPHLEPLVRAAAAEPERG